MEISQGKRLCYGISLAIVLVTAFVLVQPTMNKVYAFGVEELPAYDFCRIQPRQLFNGADTISMNTVRSGNIVKTIHAEKEIYICVLDQGNRLVKLDLTTYIEIYENIADREVIKASALVVTCIKDQFTATVIDCESYTPSTVLAHVGTRCEDFEDASFHAQEMNTVTKGNTAKTVESQKEVFTCRLGLNIHKKVDLVLFADIYENLATQEVEEVQFHSMRCVVLLTDELLNQSDDERRDATVESCQFSTIQN